MIDIDEIYLTENMKMSIPFSIWITPISFDKLIPLRFQDKKPYICPEIIKKPTSETGVDQINSWNTGVFIYELFEGRKPFLGKQNSELSFKRDISVELQTLIKKLLNKNPAERTKFSLLLVDPLFKKYKSLPHMLPQTIFSCPPSPDYVS